jgi:hypothetical protein
MEKDLIKYDGIEFSLPLAVTDNHNPTFNIFNRISRIVGEYFWKKRKDKKTSRSFRFKVLV